MLRLSRIFKNYNETGSLSEQITMRVRKMLRVCAAYSTNAKSPQESSRYEHRACSSRCT